MHKLLTTSLAVLAASTLPALADTNAAYKTKHIALDMSGSNPLVASEAYAKKAAKFVQEEIAALNPGDSVHMSLIGARGAAIDHYSYKAQVTRRRSATNIGAQAANLIAGLPSSDIPAQGATNIILYVEFGNFDCSVGDEIILVTDGIESSDDIDGHTLLEQGSGLPEPEANYLKGCSVTFYGLGKTATGSFKTSHVRNLRNAWRTYFSKAGASFKAIVQVH